MIQTYNIINNLDEVRADKLFYMNKNTSTRSSELDLYPSHTRLNIRKFSFANRVINKWNALTYSTKNAQNLNKFKNLLDLDPQKTIDRYDNDQ